MIYAIISDSNVVVNVIEAEQAFIDDHYPGAILIDGFVPSPGIGWAYASGVFTPPPPPELPPLPPPTTMYSKFGFRSRFTIAELVACDNAAFNPTLDNTQKAMLNTIMKSFDAAQDIELTNAATIYGVNYLSSCGLITPERAAEILTP